MTSQALGVRSAFVTMMTPVQSNWWWLLWWSYHNRGSFSTSGTNDYNYDGSYHDFPVQRGSLFLPQKKFKKIKKIKKMNKKNDSPVQRGPLVLPHLRHLWQNRSHGGRWEVQGKNTTFLFSNSLFFSAGHVVGISSVNKGYWHNFISVLH